MKKIIIIGLIGLMGHVHGQAIAKLSADTIALGDQTTLSIQRALTYPSTEQLSQNGIVALSQNYDSLQHTLYTTLTSFEPGTHYVILSEDDSLMLTVLDVDVDTTSAEIRDIAPIEKVPYTFWEIFRWILLGLGILALAFGGWWFWKKWKSGKVSEWLSNEPVDTRTPEERALDNLESLRQKQLWQSGRVKEYHTELTDTVRTFIEEATGIRATDMTSDETIEEMESKKWTVDNSLLRDIFTTADLVKFAKSEPLPHEHDRSMSEATEFVKSLWEQVKPKEEVPNA
ncbi:MAG: hypothetical protein IJR04_05390 [Bacteroidales bacterium]|nr:hypothetical protein [Bacteroidales bacterium]